MTLTAHTRAAIVGRALEAGTGLPVAGAHVEILAGPEAFQTIVEVERQRYGLRWPALTRRADRTVTRQDGSYFFINLPNGKYALRISVRGGSHALADVNVAYEAGEPAPPERADVVLQIADQADAPKTAPARPERRPRPRRTTGV